MNDSPKLSAIISNLWAFARRLRDGAQEMHHYRQALLRMRQGESNREITAPRLTGRPESAQWRPLAIAQDWLDGEQPLPDDEAIATALGESRRASTTISTQEAHRALLSAWVEQGVSGTAIHAALKPQHSWAGSYSYVRRLPADIRANRPPETDLLSSGGTNLDEQGSAFQENRGHEEKQVHRGTDHRVPQAG